LVLGCAGEFLDNFEDAPETADHDEGPNFFDDAAETDVDDEAGDDHRGIEAVKFGFEVAGVGLVGPGCGRGVGLSGYLEGMVDGGGRGMLGGRGKKKKTRQGRKKKKD
jgi:hypothetical protein